MKLTKKLLFVQLLFLLPNVVQAQIALPSVFTDHMVLQRNSEVPIWGWGDASATVKVVGSWFPKDTVSAVVQPDGSWKVMLKTDEAGGPYTIDVLGNGSKKINNVMLGEVWLCSGQSNMEWSPVSNINNRDEEISLADYPDIRFFHIPKRGAATPQNNCDAEWAVCTPETMKNASAVAYFFGRKLQQNLGVPVGLVVSAWGGTPAEVWTPEEAVLNDEELKAAAPTKTFPWWPVESGKLYNQMIHPLIPYRLAGTIWYQGESNHEQYATYGRLLKTMIESWRKEFDTNFPFYLVQIAPYVYNAEGNTPALLREQQEWVSKQVPETGMVVVSDLVNNINDIHPTDKQNVGLRLANMALGKHYKQISKGYVSPTFKDIAFNRNKAVLSFYDAESGLVCREKQVTGFKIEGEDGLIVDAKAEIKGGFIVVSSPQVKKPKAVYYCFDEATIGNVFSKDGLPLAPFRTNGILGGK